MNNTIYIVAADYGAYEGWQRPLGVYYTEERAFAAIGRAMVEGLWCAQNLRVVPLEVDAPLVAENPAALASTEHPASSEEASR